MLAPELGALGVGVDAVTSRQFCNELLARVAGEYPHARLVDWSSAAAAHPEWLYGDLIHPREGAEAAAMTDLLWTAIQPG
ncbi:hypothetical protein SERN_1865 [Serinibacter arcticus]|uniref:Uncharacterized protein n=1 Tax=Serinibacter arcticus TaxID=1655435 RepID=A0A4Z1E0U3_9MICO|nr:hypothetical protein SERN_1865 [Serinibacter arcticus]